MWQKYLFLGTWCLIAFIFANTAAQAAELLALKSGETVELANLFWIANCRSLLKGPMSVDILDGPPELSASIRERKIVPHSNNCPKPVDGGVLVVTAAHDVPKRLESKLVLRVKYPTIDGERQKSFSFDAIVLP